MPVKAGDLLSLVHLSLWGATKDMPLVYHGTSRGFATAMAGTVAGGGTIDVLTRGSGEFGRGFYTQESVANAMRRGQGIYGSNGAVLELTIDDAAYYGLRIQWLTLNAAQMLNARLRNQKTHGVYATTHDAIVGPLVSQPRIEQQKFQTLAAQALLNGVQTQRNVRP